MNPASGAKSDRWDFVILFRAGLFAPFYAPAIWTAAAETDKPDDLVFLEKRVRCAAIGPPVEWPKPMISRPAR